MGLVKANSPSEPSAERRADAQGPTAQQLTADLSSSDVGKRREAAWLLAEMPSEALTLCEHLRVEPSLSVRSVILTGLIVNKTPVAVAGLLGLLASEDANLRCGAIEALQEMPDEVAPHIEALLADPDSDVRIGAVTILASLPHPCVPFWLHRVLSEEQQINVCSAALDALAEVGGVESLPVLAGLRARFPDIDYVRFAVATATRRIRGY